MKRHIAGLLFLALVLALPSVAQAQDAQSWDAALTAQLSTNGIADPANATGEEIAAAVEALIANNPQLTADDIAGMVRSAVARSPASYKAVAVAAAKQAAAQGIDAAGLAKIGGAAMFAAVQAGITVTEPDARDLTSAMSQASGVTVSFDAVSQEYLGLEFAALFGSLEETGLADLIIEENPNQDASPA
jgi:hypothetical protein